VIAVLLSGLYDDGVQGLQIIHRNGGMVIVLKPDDTAFSQMPENAIKYDHPDYVLSAGDIFPKLEQLVANSQRGAAIPSNDEATEHNESASGYVCPDCGGGVI